MKWQLPIGAQPDKGGVRFRVWAPDVRRVEVVILGEGGRVLHQHPLTLEEHGYHSGYVKADPELGTRNSEPLRYMYLLDGDRLRPDPASRYQPEGVHGPSQVVDPSFRWTDGEWSGLPLKEMVIYEAHVGTATRQGTFTALIEKLTYLKSLGVTALELMPVGDFPGERNWGYDGVNLFAPARAYGGPNGLKMLVDAAHSHGLAVVLDAVYNHLGPDGNYLRDFSRDYFTTAKTTPWGDAVNFGSRPVRDFFIANALYWAHEYHVDGLRLDATHAILDDSDEGILRELARRVRESLPPTRRFAVFAEDERNDARLLAPLEEGGAALDAVWADDFHHQVRSALAGDDEGYYMDFTGSASDLAQTLEKGWFYTGQRSKFSGHRRGTDASRFDPPRFVYCIQNHDQVGNRALGDRLTESVAPEAYRAASALLLLSPCTPLLFQGQEWAASTPFLFFTDHNPELGRMVTEGRRAEFGGFKGFAGEEVPDPQALDTFLASKLRWEERERSGHAQTLALYRELLELRRVLLSPDMRRRENFHSEQVGSDAIAMRYFTAESGDVLVVVNLKGALDLSLNKSEFTRPPEGSRWEALLSTEESRFGGASGLEEVQRVVSRGSIIAAGPLAVALRAVSGH